ncbi:tail fiber protein [Niabella terrae]
MEPFVGMIAIFGFNFPPSGWSTCSGQLISIVQNTALFSLLGTTYGGNGQTTFALPNFSGRVAVGQGQGPGLSNYFIGQQTGTENLTLLSTNLPAHNHSVSATAESGDSASPAAAFPAGTGVFDKDYRVAQGTQVVMHSQMTGMQGANLPFSVINPVLGLNVCIALQGIFPPRS